MGLIEVIEHTKRILSIMKKKMKNFKISLLLGGAIVIMLISSCKNTATQYTDTPTSGTVKIAVDETLFPVMDSEIYTFMASYKDAKIIVVYEPEADVFRDLINDSVKLAVVARELNENEKAAFKKQTIEPMTTKIATDAIAFIVNNENISNELTFPRMKDIISGKIKTWKNADSKNELRDIKIVFDNNGSSTTRYIKDSIVGINKLPDNWFALKKNSEVVDYVAQNKNALGIIGVSWISNRHDTLENSFKQKVKVVGLTSNDASDREYYQPYQAYIALKNYPVCRSIYIVNREARSGLGTGFSGYVAGESGQIIVKKSGLMPATQSVRLVHLQSQKIQ